MDGETPAVTRPGNKLAAVKRGALAHAEQPVPGTGFHAHDADAVADDIVQLARDAATLFGDRNSTPLVALALQLRRALGEAVCLEAQHPERATDHQATSRNERRHHETAAEVCASQATRREQPGQRHAGSDCQADAAGP